MDDPTMTFDQVDSISEPVITIEPREGDLVVAPDSPSLFAGHKSFFASVAKALDRSPTWVEDHIRRDFDPIPARWGMMGYTLRRDRLERWCLRYGYDTVPRPGLQAIQGRRPIAEFLGISEPLLKIYHSTRAPWGRIPIRTTRGILWGYVDAIVDWVDSQSMSLLLREHLLATNLRHQLLSQPPARRRRALLLPPS